MPDDPNVVTPSTGFTTQDHSERTAVTDPTERVLAALRRLGCRYKPEGKDKYRGLCPNHRDVRPSLSVTRKPDQVLLNCFAGCGKDQLLATLGLEKRDLFLNPTSPSPKPTRGRRVIDVYPYEDDDGRLLAEKVRYEPKSFAWRRPST